MELRRLFDELVRAAERASVDVRLDAFDPQLSDVKRPRGGLCTLRGQRLIVVDAALPLPEQVATVAAALARVDLDHLYLPPIVRATIGAYQGAVDAQAKGAGSTSHALARTKSLL
ncbi:MAG TPA: hypothetical protein VGM56_02295 [Byssovorax sp.]